MDENNIPVPAPPEPQALTPEVPQANVPPQDPHQKRIDELTQQLREKERQAQEAYKTVAELAARDAAAATRQVAPPAPEDPLADYREKLDPVAIEAMRRMQESLEKKFQAQYRQLESSVGVRQIEAVASSIAGLPAQVVQHAQKLYEDARARGFTPSHDEAINYAIGDYVRKGGKLAPAAPAPAPQYGSQYAVLPGQAPTPRPANALPANMERLSRKEQLAAYRAAGYDDLPL